MLFRSRSRSAPNFAQSPQRAQRNASTRNSLCVPCELCANRIYSTNTTTSVTPAPRAGVPLPSAAFPPTTAAREKRNLFAPSRLCAKPSRSVSAWITRRRSPKTLSASPANSARTKFVQSRQPGRRHPNRITRSPSRIALRISTRRPRGRCFHCDPHAFARGAAASDLGKLLSRWGR